VRAVQLLNCTLIHPAEPPASQHFSFVAPPAFARGNAPLALRHAVYLAARMSHTGSMRTSLSQRVPTQRIHTPARSFSLQHSNKLQRDLVQPITSVRFYIAHTARPPCNSQRTHTALAAHTESTHYYAEQLTPSTASQSSPLCESSYVARRPQASSSPFTGAALDATRRRQYHDTQAQSRIHSACVHLLQLTHPQPSPSSWAEPTRLRR
jgi:hypothetical protein